MSAYSRIIRMYNFKLYVAQFEIPEYFKTGSVYLKSTARHTQYSTKT